MPVVGVIGAGQLGRMLGLAGRALDLEFEFLDPAPRPPAGIAGRVLSRPFDDPESLASLAARCDVVTYEFENVPITAAEPLSQRVPVRPPVAALAAAQDRCSEKRLFGELSIPVADWRSVDSMDDLEAAVREIGLPLVLKTRRLGYDGKGQVIVREGDDPADAFERLGRRRLVAEALIPFDREVSIIGARRVNGDVACYPLTENRHEAGILRCSLAPVDDEALGALARDYVGRLLERLDYTGVLALELFVTGEKLLANEFAPRVHNSGHWTIEGAVTSQFENHLRAILDLPLGDTAPRGYAAMINLIGEMPDRREAFEAAGFRLHDYDKAPRPGRKLGHLTAVEATAAARDRAMETALALLEGKAIPPSPSGV